MKIKTMPKDVAAELLRYLSDHEDFACVDSLDTDLTGEGSRALLREIADELMKEVATETKAAYDVKACKALSKEAKNIISCLSPREEKNLLTAFGLIEKQAGSEKK